VASGTPPRNRGPLSSKAWAKSRHLACSSGARSTSALPSARGGCAAAPGPSPASSVTTSGRLRSAAASAASATTWPQACPVSREAPVEGRNPDSCEQYHHEQCIANK